MADKDSDSLSIPLKDRMNRIKGRQAEDGSPAESDSLQDSAARNANEEWKEWYALISDATKKLRQ